MPAGYSGTPLAKKLNLRDGQRCWFYQMPENVQDEIGEYALELIFVGDPSEGVDAAHIFVTEQADLERLLKCLRNQIAKDGQVWISWPKQASKVLTEVGEHEVRKSGLEAGFIDTKKCAVDEVWSGLKLVIPKKDR